MVKALFGKKTGPARVEAAFGLFDKVISDLENAAVVCAEERTDYNAEALRLRAKAQASTEAGARAKTAASNIRKLIGE